MLFFNFSAYARPVFTRPFISALKELDKAAKSNDSVTLTF